MLEEKASEKLQICFVFYCTVLDQCVTCIVMPVSASCLIGSVLGYTRLVLNLNEKYV